jgi:3-methyladenine DNA glycosylase AlkD
VTSVPDVLRRLEARAYPENLEGMSRFGISTRGRLGVSVPDMRAIAKEIGRDHRLALALWKTGIGEARQVAAMIDDPRQVTERQMETWVADFDSWDVCDGVSMSLFENTSLVWKKIREWAQRDEEFVKRASFALIAGRAWHDKAAPDSRFLALLPVIERAATDERNFVKKAVNWALRNIGKRNPKLNRAAIRFARRLRQSGSRSARWIAADAIRELESDAVARRLAISRAGSRGSSRTSARATRLRSARSSPPPPRR